MPHDSEGRRGEPNLPGAGHLQVAGPKSVKIGTCAWSFEDWRGTFYPEHLSPNHRLEYYARFFNSVEVDSTFYAIPSRHATQHWAEVTPADFTFAAKLFREITHERKLRHSEDLLESFLLAMEPMQSKLAAILIQLPPSMNLRNDEHALREFVARLPVGGGFRFAVEFRDPSWHLPRIAHLLESHQVCWVWNDISKLDHSMEGAFEALPRTTDFLYLRLLGDLKTKYDGDGSRIHQYRSMLWPRDSALETWALRIQQHFEQVSKVLVFTNNHYEGFAPESSRRLAARLGWDLPLPTALDVAGRKPPDPRQLELL